MCDVAYYDGVYSKYEDARVPLSDRAMFFGDGVYDVMLMRNGHIYQSDVHLARLRTNAARLGLSIDKSDRDLCSVIHKLYDISCYGECCVYIQVSRRTPRRNHGTAGELSPALLVTVTKYAGYSDECLGLVTLPDIRHGMCDVKTLNLLPAVLAVRTAEATGYDEAVLIRDGNVTEGARSNVSILSGGVLITHGTDNRILPGVMRANLIRTCKQLGIPVVEREFSEAELCSADEVLVTSTTKLLRRGASVNGVPLPMSDFGTFTALRDELLSDYLSHTC